MKSGFSKFSVPQFTIALLALLGIADSAYLTYEHFGHSVICIGSGCSIVDASVYSEIFGIPLGVLGLLIYLILLGLVVSLAVVSDNFFKNYIHLSLYGISLTGLIFSFYLTYLEFFAIKAVCTWCMVSLFLMVAIFILSVLNLRKVRGT